MNKQEAANIRGKSLLESDALREGRIEDINILEEEANRSDEELNDAIIEIEKIASDLDSAVFGSQTKKHSRYSKRRQGRLENPNEETKLRKSEDLVASITKMKDAFSKVIVNAFKALLSIKESMMKAYEKVHAEPYESTVDYLRSGAEADKKYTEEEMSEMYKRYQNIGQIEQTSEAELVGRVGIRGVVGELINKSSNKFWEFVTDAESLGDEEREINNINMNLIENYIRQTE